MKNLVDSIQKNMTMKFEQNELLVLKPEFDDKNYKRVYQVIDIVNTTDDKRLKVKVISAKSTDPGRFPENCDNTLVGQILGPFEDKIFKSYL